ncbi:Hypothetical protein CINCED_3A013201 [Cinara cedri]|uniref:Uncharacterized protein n=1 Tax=Cinara cedri TaxID=506608 RepID=A0A5E4M358_9HEMI|nr:Hypothetical protein CINCED_3A013201 [Cinara cedri]
MEYQKLLRSSSRPSTSTPLTKAATYAGFTGPQNVRCRRRLVYDDDFGDGDQHLQHLDRHNNNNNSNNSTNAAINATTTSLVDELEQLRTDNFQLRLRVYNAERRVDRLSASRNGNPKKCNDSSSDSDTGTGSDSTTDDSGGGGGVRAGKTAVSYDDQAIAAAKAKATAEAAVRTIHDLLTVNKRLLALLAATVSAKAVAVSAGDKRRWQRLRNHIDNYDQDYVEEDEETRQDSNNDETDSSTTTDSETCMTRLSAKRATAASDKRQIPSSPPTPTPAPAHNEHPAADNDSPGSELACLRARCRRLERSLQQLVNTELWARNRQIGKLEQQRYVTQVADAAAQRERQQMMAASAVPPDQSCSKAAPTVTSPPVTKGILVKRSPVTGTKTPPTAEAATAAGTAAVITTPPPVLPDYSEVNFFFSCDEVDEEDESESNTLSSAEEDTNQSDDVEEDEPVRLVPAAVTAPSVTAGSPTVRPRKRQRRKGGAEPVTVLTTSSSTDSVPMTGGGGVTTTTTTTSPTLSRRTHRRRRRRRTSSGLGRFSMCCRCGGGVKNSPSAIGAGTADAQVQCSDPENGGAAKSNKTGNDQLVLLRRELDARRRENSRLYDMLLRLQRGRDRRKDDDDREGPKSPPSDPADADARDVTVDSNSDRADSPEPYRRATRAVRGRIADLLPPLLSSRSASVAPAVNAQRGSDELCLSGADGGAGEQQQQQQQLLLLSRLRERILAYERQELLGGGDNSRPSLSSSAAAASEVTDSEGAVRRMDRAALVNVALPRAVDRLRRALVPLMQQPDEPAPIDRVPQDSPLERRTLMQLSASGDDDDRRR